jgi:hypothetical protein
MLPFEKNGADDSKPSLGVQDAGKGGSPLSGQCTEELGFPPSR